MKLRIVAEAEAEIEVAWLYLNEQSRGLGSRFLDDLTAAFDGISAAPASFPKLETLIDALPYRRAVLATFQYIVVFEIIATDIVVVAVSHAHRVPHYWLGRSE